MRSKLVSGLPDVISYHGVSSPSDVLIPERTLIPTDPLFGLQWFLLNTAPGGVDINVVDVWDDYTGAGVIVGIVDDGVSYTHPDLDGNYDTSLDQDAVENDNDAFPTFDDTNTGDNHGTAVAGVIAAENDGSGVVGVAFGATITGLRIGFTASDGNDQPASNFNYAAANGIDILNNSWGFGGFFSDSDDFNNPAFFGLASALENAVENGRGGLGIIVFFSSGNDGDQGQDANYHSLSNSRYTITVGAIDRDGIISSFSTPGAPVFVVLPGEAITTTDREGSLGYVSGGSVSVDGTSFSSPVGAGIAALILEANPDLGWRDVQEIFALSAIQLDASHTSWEINGADNWNGGGLHTSRFYGFGLTDTLAAVRLAETWTAQSTSANEVSVSGASSPSTTIADLSTITDTITINSGVDIDHVVITLNISHTAPEDLIITLISPDGTESQIVVQPGVVPGTSSAGADGTPSANINFTLSSTEFWGETGEGTWTLRVQDSLFGASGTLNSWSIELFGDALTDDDTYYFTDEYATFATGDVSRQLLDDALGINTINAAAVTTNLVLDLTGATASTVAGTPLDLAPGTIIHNAYAGDGDDIITGNAFDNTILGGRGDDTIDGGAGVDTAMYFSASTDFTFTVLGPTQIEVSYTGLGGIDDGTDIVTGVEFFEFSDGTLTKTQVEALAGGGFTIVDGTAGNDALVGTFSFDQLNGFAGNDTLEGLGGNDELNGGDGTDTAIYSGNLADYIATQTDADSLTINDTVGGRDGNDTVNGIEFFQFADQTVSFADLLAMQFNIVTGTANNDVLNGTAGADRINGLDGNDRITGGPGIDELNGGDGDDLFLVGIGDGPDTFMGGLGTDTIAASEAGVAISFEGSFDAGNSIEVITNDAPGTTTLTGTSGNDTLDVSAETDAYFLDGLAGRDTLRGGSGDDALAGGAGNDFLTGNGGADTFIFANGSGTDRILDFDPTSGDVINLGGVTGLNSFADVQAASITFQNKHTLITFADGSRIIINNVLPAELSADDFSFSSPPSPNIASIARAVAVAGVTIAGTSGDDDYNFATTTLTGIDSIDMGDGDDNVIGSAGADVINGDGGDDSLEGGQGNDTISGGIGNDTAVFAGNLADYTPTQIDGDSLTITDNVGTDGTDTINGVESFQFADQTVSFSQLLGLIVGPVFSSGSAVNFAENGIGVAYDADATDADSAAPTYAITGGADAALFNIDGVTGEVTFKASPDFEAPTDAGGNNVYDIEITASSGGDDTVQPVAITVTNVNDVAPVFTSGTAVNFAEAGTGVAYDANATDVEGDILTYSISGGDDAAFFNIDSVTGEVTFKTPPDFETPADGGANNTYLVDITASDGTNDAVQTVTITVTDVTGPPVFTSGTIANFAENGAGTAYDADATSPDGPAPTFAITGGADAALFDIDGVTGVVTFKAPPDFEAPTDAGGNNVYDIAITASSDGLNTIQNVAITVTDVNDVAPVFTSGTAVNFAENGTGTAYDASATDVDGGVPTFSITGGADAALFNIDGTTGEVTFKTSPNFESPSDAGGNNIYDIQITANDGLNNTVQSVAITVTDVANEFNVINGTAGVDDLVGTAGADQINGLGGADSIDGGAGIDELNGGDGDDLFLVGVGDGPDTFNGGIGTDTIAATEAGVAISFAGGAFGPGNSIEIITNNAPGGLTTLTGTAGNDTLDVSAETDPYFLDGLAGRDTLRGGTADDFLAGGAGNDFLTGNAGADTFIIGDGAGTDRITDFDTTSGDVINLGGATGLNSFADVQAASTILQGKHTLITFPDGSRIIITKVLPNELSADDFDFSAPPAPSFVGISRAASVAGTTIAGTAGNDAYDFSATTLIGIDSIDMGAGNDTVVGSVGADVINGDGDDDTLTGGQGNDTISGGTGSDTAVFAGNLADYTPTQVDANSLTITDNVGTDGSDTITEVEFFQFADQTVSFDQLLGLLPVPVFTSGTTANFAENGGGVAYDADATDADGPAPTYAITGGADAALFNIDGATGEVTFKTAPDFEAPTDAGGNNVYDIEITASSGGDDTVQSVAITVTNVNDNAPVFTSGTAVNFAENGTGTAYDADATDADGTSPTYSISGGVDAALFNIDGTTGEVTFIAPPDFEIPTDAGANNVYDLEITATDGLNSAVQSVAITVTDVVNEGGGGLTTLTGTAGRDTLDVSTEIDPYFLVGLGGRDTLRGGSADDFLDGGTGNDFLTGNAGADTFIIGDGSGADRITDFDTASGDVINLGGATGLNSFADVQAASFTVLNKHTQITLPDGSRVLILNVLPGELSADDFDFSAPPAPAAVSISPTQAIVGISAEAGAGVHAVAPVFDFGADDFILSGGAHALGEASFKAQAFTIDQPQIDHAIEPFAATITTDQPQIQHAIEPFAVVGHDDAFILQSSNDAPSVDFKQVGLLSDGPPQIQHASEPIEFGFGHDLGFETTQSAPAFDLPFEGLIHPETEIAQDWMSGAMDELHLWGSDEFIL